MSTNNSVGAHDPAKKVCALVVDDDATLRELLRISLERSGYEVLLAFNGVEALKVFDQHEVQLVLLDVLMPEMDGFATCTALRQRSNVPIIMLTALNRPDDIVQGLRLGADDYITKPFTFREVEVRLHAVLRRVNWLTERKQPPRLTVGEIVLNEEPREVTVRGEHIHLTSIEFHILRYLMSRPDRSVSKAELFSNVWGGELYGATNLVEVAVHRLREKIERDPAVPRHLLTVRGVGYKFSSNKNTK